MRRVAIESCFLALTAALTTALSAQGWRTDFDQPEATFGDLLKLRTAQGYCLTYASARGTPNGNRFELIWTEGSTSRTKVGHGLDHAGLQTLLTTSPGYRPVSIDSYDTYPNEKYIVLLVQDTVAWHVRLRMTTAQFQAEKATQTARNYGLIQVGASGTDPNARYCGVWAMPHGTVSTAHELSISSLDTENKLRKLRGGRLSSLASARSATAPTFSAVWDNSGGITRELYAQNLNDLLNKVFEHRIQGYRPVAVVGYEDSAGLPRYVSSWRYEPNFPRFTITGVSAPALSGFDSAMQRIMSRTGITQATLAVTKDKRLMLARGYTNGQPTLGPTEPQSLSRIASLTKAPIVVGVLQLVQAGKIDLDQKINTILDMRGFSDSRVQDITVRHLMNHWGGWDRAITPTPILKDADISRVTGKPLPITPQMIFDYMKTVRLDHAPGQRFAYANFGFELLGHIIEKVTDRRLEDYMLTEVYLPIGASSARVTYTLRGDQIPGEIEYDDRRTGASVMGSSSPPTVQYPYGIANLRAWPGAGAWVASAIDYARFLVTFDDKSKSPLLSASMIDEIYKRPPWDRTSNSAYYGLGQVVQLRGNGKMDLFHDGGFFGTRTLMYRHESGMNFAVFFNSNTVDLNQVITEMISTANAVRSWPSHDLFPTYASMSSFGHGCRGSNGVPYLRPIEGSLSKVGYPFTVEMAAIGTSPSQNLPFLTIGGSRTNWAGATLPVDLRPLGMPGCALNVSPDVLIPLTNLGGTARFSIDIPNVTALVGAELLMQGLVLDPGINALDLVTTAGVRMQAGVR